jgi:predicted negative regulator of RcsB-dependent stress response
MESKVIELPLSDKLWAWFLANQKPVFGFAAAAVVVGLITWFVLWHHDEKANTAADALSAITVVQAITGSSQPETSDSYLKVATTYPDSTAGARALLLAAGTLFTQEKYAEAQAQFEKFTREHRDSPFMGQALLGIAACLDAQGKTDQAIAAYKDLAAHHSDESFIYQAKFSLACLYEAQNKPELARDLFTEVEREDRVGSTGNEAARRLNDLLTRLPKLAPNSLSSTNAPMMFQKK